MKEICPGCGYKVGDCIYEKPILDPNDDIPPTLRSKIKEVETMDEEEETESGARENGKPSFSFHNLKITPQILLDLQFANITENKLIHP